MTTPKLINCSGSFIDMGKKQGRTAKPLIPKIFKTLLESEFTPNFLRRHGSASTLKKIFTLLGFKRYPGLRFKLKKKLPHQFERLRGIAKSSSISMPCLVSLNSIEVTATQLKYIHGCTSIGFHPQRLKDIKNPILAYNHDFPNFFKQFVVLRRSKPNKAYHSLQLTYPSLAGAFAGVNEKGMIATLNQALAIDKKRYGIPPTLFVQEILDQCHQVSQAIKLLGSVESACGSTITLVDRKGDMAAVELSKTRMAVRRPQDGIIYSINQYLTKRMAEVEIPQNTYFDPKKFSPIFHGIAIHANNQSRKKRLPQLLKQKRRFQISDIKSILKDHNRQKKPSNTTICRHHSIASTIASAMIYSSKGAMEVVTGNPCQNARQRYCL